MKKAKIDKSQPRQVAVRNKKGDVLGYVTMYWCETLKTWVTIPE